MTARAFAIMVFVILGLVAGGCLALPFVLAYQAGERHAMH